MITQNLQTIFQEIFSQLFDISLSPSIETPPKKDLGDFCVSPFEIVKILKKNPREIAEKIANTLKEDERFSQVNIAGPYVNFSISPAFFNTLFFKNTPSLPQKNGEKIFVDYIGMNVGKPMHIGHMCTPSQGQITMNLAKKLGYTAIGDSHLWDWGIIFGKLITAYKKWWDWQKLEENAVAHLLELYVQATSEAENNPSLESEFRETFTKLSSWEKEYVEIWESFTEKSIMAMQIQLDRLRVKPTYHIGESFYEGIGLPKMGEYPDLTHSMKDIVQELVEKNIASQNDDGSVGVIFDESLKIPSCILAKRDGSHGYLASDLAAIKYRSENWNPEKIIYHVDVRQDLHFRQAFDIASRAGWIEKEKLFFAANGFISLKSGTMSTRTGNIIKLEDLLDEAVERAGKILQEKNPDISPEELEKLSEIIGIGAIKFGYLSKSRQSDMVFDWDEFMTFEGKSFPYVAYNYVRAKRILEHAGYIPEKNISAHFSTPPEMTLYRDICEFPTICIHAFEQVAYHGMVEYSYTLAKSFSAFYTSNNILSIPDDEKKNFLLHLVYQYTKIQEELFEILAISLPEKM